GSWIGDDCKCRSLAPSPRPSPAGRGRSVGPLGANRIAPVERPAAEEVHCGASGLPLPESVSENSILGSTGHWPVPSGDSPDGTGRASPTNEIGLLLGVATLVPVGGSPTGTGGSPVPPIFQTRSEGEGRGEGEAAARTVCLSEV